ncbi:hypothetical protein Acr_19g0000450 [Actinidia rufa]|uniref:Reverse transcriptase zinc-binding domain-containing protein n=1 Tax=Actinidia rufa TaxID=165716 RepID=A0A7J0G8S6_9ERIC|nr:hypothetical protein Acr_19g0000450 [Actinidia rufa]
MGAKIQQNMTQIKMRQDSMATTSDTDKKKSRKHLVARWNIRGMNKPLKQNGILEYTRKNKVDIMGILETKLKHQRTRDVVKHNFRRWATWDNFQQQPNGKIMIIWKADKVDLQILECSEQVIHCLAICKLTNSKFSISFVYAFNTIVGRRPLWDNLDRFNDTLTDPWLVLGDFNNVLKTEERSNGQQVTPYEIRDFQQCCNKLGLVDTVYSGALLTWTNNSTWCKLDRAMINNRWIADGLMAHAHFGFPWKLSDHSPCVVSLFDNSMQGVKPFKFFNMWSLHDDFQRIVGEGWSNRIHGSAMFRLTSRTAAAGARLYDIQQQLHDNPTDSLLQDRMVEVKSSALRLAEAERSYCSQLAKIKFPFRYLGLPVGATKLTIAQFHPFTDRIADYINSWAGSMQARHRMEQWASDGRFCSKTAYDFFRPRRVNLTWPKLVWHSCITPKHSFILWLGLKDRLLTRDKMHEFSEEKICPLCCAADESVDHLFFQCNVERPDWICPGVRGLSADPVAVAIAVLVEDVAVLWHWMVQVFLLVSILLVDIDTCLVTSIEARGLIVDPVGAAAVLLVESSSHWVGGFSAGLADAVVLAVLGLAFYSPNPVAAAASASSQLWFSDGLAATILVVLGCSLSGLCRIQSPAETAAGCLLFFTWLCAKIRGCIWVLYVVAAGLADATVDVGHVAVAERCC